MIVLGIVELVILALIGLALAYDDKKAAQAFKSWVDAFPVTTKGKHRALVGRVRE